MRCPLINTPSSELGRVEEAEDPRHGELRHRQEEGAWLGVGIGLGVKG